MPGALGDEAGHLRCVRGRSAAARDDSSVAIMEACSNASVALMTTDGTDVAYASVGAGQAAAVRERLAQSSAAELGAAGGAGVLREPRDGLPARALRPCRMRAVGGIRSTAVVWQFELEQLAAVAATLGPEPFDLMGTSMGALVAVAWAAAHPEHRSAPRALRRLGVRRRASPRRACAIMSSGWSSRTGVWARTCSPTSSPPTPIAVDTCGVRPLPAGLLDRRHRPGAAGAELRRSTSATSSRRFARRRWWCTAPTTARHPSRRPRRSPTASAVPSWWCCPGARTCRTRVTRELVRAIRRFLGLRSLPRAPRALTARQTRGRRPGQPRVHEPRDRGATGDRRTLRRGSRRTDPPAPRLQHPRPDRRVVRRAARPAWRGEVR